jgi:hypothetical protein
MSERIVAGQIADVAEALETMRETMAKRAPPQVTVNVPESPVTVKVPDQLPQNVHLNFLERAVPPQVTVQVPEAKAPTVNVKAPTVNVLPPPARAYDVRITERDENGFIRAFKITPA